MKKISRLENNKNGEKKNKNKNNKKIDKFFKYTS